MAYVKKELEPDYWDLVDELKNAFLSRFGISINEDFNEVINIIDKEYIKANKGNTEKLSRSKKNKHYLEHSFIKEYWPAKGKRNTKHTPNKRYLSVIAESIGYKSFDHFCVIKRQEQIVESHFYNPLDYVVERMKKKEYTIGWYPEYYAKLEYLGEYQFKILECSYNLRNLFKKDKTEPITIYGFGLCYTLDLTKAPMQQEKEEGKSFEGYLIRPRLFFRPDKNKDKYNNGETCIIISS